MFNLKLHFGTKNPSNCSDATGLRDSEKFWHLVVTKIKTLGWGRRVSWWSSGTKTSPSSAGVQHLVRELRSHYVPRGPKPKHKNISNIVTNSKEDLKNSGWRWPVPQFWRHFPGRNQSK